MSRLPKLVALDLDGTLLNRAKVVSARNAAAVRALAEAGCTVVLASGRMYRDCMAPHVEQLGLDAPVICYNGAVVYDPVAQRILSEMPVAPALADPVIDFAAETDRTVNLYWQDTLYCRRETDWTRLYVSRTGAKPVFREDLFTWFRGKPSTKVLMLDEPPVIEGLLVEWKQRVGDRLYVTISDPEYLEFMDPGATKGWALRRVCELLDIRVEETAAFGDARNDLPLIQTAGLGVAMANARPELQAAADEIAPDHDDDGVAQVIERWLNDGVTTG